jgi:hypothetical protein
MIREITTHGKTGMEIAHPISRIAGVRTIKKSIPTATIKMAAQRLVIIYGATRTMLLINRKFPSKQT